MLRITLSPNFTIGKGQRWLKSAIVRAQHTCGSATLFGVYSSYSSGD